MEIRPILSTLRRHPTTAILLALEIAIACAVFCNVSHLIVQNINTIRVVSGTHESDLAVVRLQGYGDIATTDLHARLLNGLAAIPGVTSVNAINTVPFGAQSGTSGITLTPGASDRGPAAVVDFYIGSPGAYEALQLRLVAGRGPQAEDFVSIENFLPSYAQVQITRSLARHLWPNQDPLGKEFWMLDSHFRVVGVVDRLLIAQPGSRGPQSIDWSVFVPSRNGPNLMGNYLLRAPPVELPRVLHDAQALVGKIAPEVVLDEWGTRTMGELRSEFFQQDRSMAVLMSALLVALLLVTALGIAGLTHFWVAQRHRQIGIRRALGATRGDILRYFQTENFLIVAPGVCLGMLLAYAGNLALMAYYELPRLPLPYLPVGAGAMWALGQLAILGPARRASSMPPAVATRSI